MLSRSTGASTDGWSRALLALGALIIATRWPFLDAGFGADYDAWLLADSARTLRLDGAYRPSRPPGYPVTEVLMALAQPWGPLGLNLISTLACAASCILAASLLRPAGAARAWLAAAACAFVPVVFVASVSAMDYLVSLALFLGALRAAAADRRGIAAVAMALAIGARPANGALMPALWLFIGLRSGWRPGWRFVISSTLLAAVLHIPVVASRGLEYLRPTVTHYPSATEVFRIATFGVFGSLGLGAAALGLSFATRGLSRGWFDPEARAMTRSLLAVVALCGATFLSMPHDAGYLIPAVFAFAMLVAAHSSSRVLSVFVALVIASGFVEAPSGDPGAILRDRSVRRDELRALSGIARALDTADRPVLLVTGPMHSKLLYVLGQNRDGASAGSPHRIVLGIASATEAHEYASRGYALEHVPGIESWHAGELGQELAALGVHPLSLGLGAGPVRTPARVRPPDR